MLQRRKIAWLSPLIVLLLNACGTERVITRPVIHERQVACYVPVPLDFLEQPTLTSVPDDLTYGEALTLWAEDRAALLVAVARLRSIQALNQRELPLCEQ